MSTPTDKPRPTRWWLVSLGIALAAALVVLLVRFCPTSPITLFFAVFILVFALAMLANPAHWLRKLASLALTASTIAASIPTVAGWLNHTPTSSGAPIAPGAAAATTDAGFLIDNSPWAAIALAFAAVAFAFLDIWQHRPSRTHTQPLASSPPSAIVTTSAPNSPAASASNNTAGRDFNQGATAGNNSPGVANAPIIYNNYSSSTAEDIARITEHYTRKQVALESSNAALQQQLDTKDTELATLRAAFDRVAVEARAGNPQAQAAIAEARASGSAEKLQQALIAEADRRGEAIQSAAAEYIELCREIAAIAYLRGDIDEAKKRLEVVLRFFPDDAEAINRTSQVQYLRGELDAAASSLNKLLTLPGVADDVNSAAYGNLGLIERTRGNLDAAETYHKKSLEIEERLGRTEGMANQYGNLGLIELTRGNLDAAEAYLKRSLAIEEKRGRAEGMASDYGNLGLIERRRGNLDIAETYHKKSLAIEQQRGRSEGMANQYGNLGLVEWTRGNLDAAEAYLKKALAINEKLERPEGMAGNYGNLGLIERRRGNLDAAEAYHRKSLAIEEKVGRPEGMANQYGNLGLIEQTRGNLDAAEAYHQKSLAIEEKLGRPEGMAIDYGNLGLIEQRRGNLDAAEAYHKKSLAIEEKLRRYEGVANQYGNLGLLAQQRGDLARARELWTRSRDLYAKIGMPHMIKQLQDLLDQLDTP